MKIQIDQEVLIDINKALFRALQGVTTRQQESENVQCIRDSINIINDELEEQAGLRPTLCTNALDKKKAKGFILITIHPLGERLCGNIDELITKLINNDTLDNTSITELGAGLTTYIIAQNKKRSLIMDVVKGIEKIIDER